MPRNTKTTKHYWIPALRKATNLDVCIQRPGKFTTTITRGLDYWAKSLFKSMLVECDIFDWNTQIPPTRNIYWRKSGSGGHRPLSGIVVWRSEGIIRHTDDRIFKPGTWLAGQIGYLTWILTWISLINPNLRLSFKMTLDVEINRAAIQVLSACM